MNAQNGPKRHRSAVPPVMVCRADNGERISVAARAPIAIGQSVGIAVRPEHIRIAAADCTESNLIPGHIVEIVDLGLSRRYRIATPVSPRALIVTEPGRATVSSRKPGDAVMLAFGIEDASVIYGAA